jgi:ABC-type transport system substrate-binding protein
LRHGVHFQDGSLMNAQDVVDSLKADIPQGGLLWDSVKSLVPVGTYAVRFVLKYPMQIDYILIAEYDAVLLQSRS